MKDTLLSISNQQEAERAIVALKVVAKQANDPCAQLSAELIDCTQKLLFQKNSLEDEKQKLLNKISVLIIEIGPVVLSSKRSNFHLAILNDIGKCC